ncbi:PIN domain-containing protein [Jatrophihabitans cynanchi]|uniref:Ribonuclease VapC n=1 Tax=Jatrophihabitans cynanchi TaxID=2944128 RepID=A0ABY7K0L2_9ACTN|nr:PIN domain-containing protein [Jatrophihabitans sp. SB3-54]WAX58347.1 PIN domain-containing protein [Jatrophihabitans sp. SB3-54]
MTDATIVDTGPLVALLSRNDTHHRRCVEFFGSLTGTPLLPTTVLVEVCWLLENEPTAEAEFLDSVAAGAFKLLPLTKADLTRTAELVRQYADFPLGTVDASVIALAERLKLHEIITLDHRHFRAVRPRHIPAFTLLPS